MEIVAESFLDTGSTVLIATASAYCLPYNKVDLSSLLPSLYKVWKNLTVIVVEL